MAVIDLPGSRLVILSIREKRMESTGLNDFAGRTKRASIAEGAVLHKRYLMPFRQVKVQTSIRDILCANHSELTAACIFAAIASACQPSAGDKF